MVRINLYLSVLRKTKLIGQNHQRLLTMIRLYGIEGKIGIERDNGETNEPAFPTTQGR